MGLGVGWMVELKLNRKEKKHWIPTGGLRPPIPPRSATDSSSSIFIDTQFTGVFSWGALGSLTSLECPLIIKSHCVIKHEYQDNFVTLVKRLVYGLKVSMRYSVGGRLVYGSCFFKYFVYV